MSKLTGGQHIGNVLTTPLGATIRGQYVGAFLEVATASGIDNGSAYGYHSELTADIMARRLLHSVLTMTAAHTGIIQERAVLTARRFSILS